jgi:hypothetical protein
MAASHRAAGAAAPTAAAITPGLLMLGHRLVRRHRATRQQARGEREKRAKETQKPTHQRTLVPAAATATPAAIFPVVVLIVLRDRLGRVHRAAREHEGDGHERDENEAYPAHLVLLGQSLWTPWIIDAERGSDISRGHTGGKPRREGLPARREPQAPFDAQSLGPHHAPVTRF